jgi:hypothetical protein
MSKNNLPGSSGGRGPLRQWAEASYSPTTGHPASSVFENKLATSEEGDSSRASAQLSNAKPVVRHPKTSR